MSDKKNENPAPKASQEKDPSSQPVNTTKSVADAITRARLKLDDASAKTSSITVDIEGTEAPIIFHNRQEIILGRADPKTDKYPDIDMSGLPINFASISRRHMRLIFVNGNWHAEDMGSSNGTWLNGNLMVAYKRYPLRNGDRFRVGTVDSVITFEDLPMTVAPELPELSEKPSTVVSDTTTTPPVLDTLTLTTAGMTEKQQGVSPKYLQNNILPYVNAITDMMLAVDYIKKRPKREISIVAIVVKYPHITIQLSYQHEVLEFLTDITQKAASDNNITKALTALKQDNDDILDDPEAVAHFIKTFTNKYLPLVPTSQLGNIENSLKTLFRVIFRSDLQIVIIK